MEGNILTEIRNSEKIAEDIIERTKRERESMIHKAKINSSKLFGAKEEEIKKTQEKKLIDFREKSKLITEEKIGEGRKTAKQVKTKSEKNVSKAVDFVIKKFEKLI